MSRRALAVALAAALAACASYGPRGSAGLGTKIAVRPVVNKSQQPSLEDQLGLAVRDEFLRDARYQVTPEAEAKDVLAVTITRYTLKPTQYDVTLAPSTYKLSILVDLKMIDRASGATLWEEKDLEGAFTYPVYNLAGGMTEPQAQTEIWTILSPMIVERAADGFAAAAKEAADKAAKTPVVK
jgi:hypothetical protein